MSKKKTFAVTKEMLEHTKHGYKFMMELRLYSAMYGVKEFNRRYNTRIESLKDIPFDPDVLPPFSNKK